MSASQTEPHELQIEEPVVDTSLSVAAAPSAVPGAVPGAPQQQAPLPSVAEFEPPLACVRRILKHALPSSTNVGKDASAVFARASGIFIIYVTACANDFARENKRQTITANDVLAAVTVRTCVTTAEGTILAS
jgi:histone H3/H4